MAAHVDRKLRFRDDKRRRASSILDARDIMFMQG